MYLFDICKITNCTLVAPRTRKNIYRNVVLGRRNAVTNTRICSKKKEICNAKQLYFNTTHAA